MASTGTVAFLDSFSSVGTMTMASGHRTLNLIGATGYLALVMLTFWYSRGRDQQRLRSELAMQQMITANQIQSRLAVSVESLKGLAAHLALRPELSLRDFQQVAQHYGPHQPGLLAIQWQPLLPDRLRSAREAQIRRQGGSLAAFRLWEPGPAGSPIVARPRPLHLPVLYIDSPGSRVQSTGLDLAFSPERMAVKWRAADSGTPQASPPQPLILNQAGPQGPQGLVISLPVYQNGVMPQDPALRRGRLLGFLSLLIDLQPLLAPQMRDLAADGLSLALHPEGHSLVPAQQRGDGAQVLQSTTQLQIYGQRLKLVLTGQPLFINRHRLPYSRLLIGSVTLFGGLLLAMLWLQQRINRRLEATQEQLISTVDELQQTQQELEAKRRQLRLKLRSSITASAVAHEVNQPLSTMRLLGQQMIRQLEENPGPNSALLKLVEQLMRESDQVVSTTEKMRMLLRNSHTDRQPLDLTTTVQGALLYLRRLLQEQQVEVQHEGLDQPAWIEGDGQQLRLAISNVLRNAVEALAHQPANQRCLSISLQRLPGKVQLVVADSGPGFPAEILRQNSSEDVLLHSRKPRGTGIGLYVVSTTMENHGGSLQLDNSQALGGAEVTLLLPASTPPPPPQEVAAPPPGPSEGA